MFIFWKCHFHYSQVIFYYMKSESSLDRSCYVLESELCEQEIVKLFFHNTSFCSTILFYHFVLPSLISGVIWLTFGVFLVNPGTLGSLWHKPLRPNWQSLLACGSLYKHGVFTKSMPEETRTIIFPSLSGL